MIRVLAPAKINLWLRVLGKRPDGYHDLESLVWRISLSDRLTLADSSDGRIGLECDDPLLPGGTDNLAWRAADLMRRAVGRTNRGVGIWLEKRIPSGAGLGGGSSDAAAVLLGLCRMWDIPPGRDLLLPIAEQLGADVPLFLYPTPAVMTGRGEVVRPVHPRIDAFLVVAYPGVSVSTAWAYGNFRLTKTTDKYSLSTLYEAEGGRLPPWRWPDFLVNDLEECVMERFPVVRECKEALVRLGARASLMSGSGSAVFGLFDDRTLASVAAAALSAVPGWRAEVARPLVS